MANFVFNVGKGRVAEMFNRVKTNDPANSAIVVVAINAAATDATMRDYATLSALLGDAQVSEVTNSGYARKILTDTELSTITVDHANDKVTVTIPDQTWTAVAAGTNWTDLVLCYDNDTTSGNDTNLIPLTCHDFVITPDGSDIVADAGASTYEAS